MKAEGNRWSRNETIWSTSLGLATKFMFGSSYLNLVSQASCLTTPNTMIGLFDMIVKPVRPLLLMKYASLPCRLALTRRLVPAISINCRTFQCRQLLMKSVHITIVRGLTEYPNNGWKQVF